MASASLWKDIDDKFCLCSICLEQFKEPKSLQCLHRFCKDCLDKLLKTSCGSLRCPECREEVEIPTNGIDGFKTDFYMKNLVEYVQIQQSLQSDEIRECYSCSKYLRATAYCFKCCNFLCTDCHHVHITNRTLKDHKQHTLSVKDIESKNITPEKLSSMRDAPRCDVHPSKVSELYCETCNYVPICVACMVGKHKGHDLHEVTELATVKRRMLSEHLKELEKRRAGDKLMTTNQVKERLIQNVTFEREQLQKMYKDVVQNEEIISKHIKRRLQITQDWKKIKKQKIFDSLQREMEREIQNVKRKYKERYEMKENEINDDYCIREKVLEKKLEKSSLRLEQLNKDKIKLLESIDKQLNEKVRAIAKMQEDLDKQNKRLTNLNVMASSILASENDWTAVEFIPDLCTAATGLMKDLKEDLPELETLSHIKIDYQQSFKGKPSISKLIEENYKTITTTECNVITGATGSGDGNVVITGRDGKEAVISVIDINGKVMKQKKLSTIESLPRHFCDCISPYKVALAYEPNTIGVYNVHDGSYFEKIICDVISSWPVDRYVRCIAVDPVNNHILVGARYSRDVYVFDNQLNYLYILRLPDMIKWPRDVTVSDGHLLVCDYDGRKAYVITMDRLESKVVREFVKPVLDGVDRLKPFSVCTDGDGFIYMLWAGARCYLVQYIHDGSQVLTTREVAGKAMVVSAVETAEGEKLFVGTYHKQTMYSYDLTEGF